MIQYRPYLKLLRSVVTRKGKHVYDESFHSGVNIIRGLNSSGKTTIVNFINFALGGEPSDFTNEAAQCDFAYAEVEINGRVVTLRREVEKGHQRPMAIYWGELDEAMKRSQGRWELYPYATRGNKESFSQVLFRALGIPEVRSEEMSARITMHQILRIIYADQMTAPDQIFRSEHFDYRDVRDASGRLLCGIYDEKLYDLKLKLRELQDEHSVISKQFKHILSVLSDADQIPNILELETSLEERKKERKEGYQKLKYLRSHKKLSPETEVKKSDRIAQLQVEISKISEKILSLEEERSNIILQIEDTILFLKSLESNIENIDESVETQRSLGTVDFKICPACYTPIKPAEGRPVCPLCKEEIIGNEVGSKILRVKQELGFQISESKILQEERNKRLMIIESQLPGLKRKRETLQLEFEGLNLQVTTEYEAELGDLERQIGYLDREIEDLDRQIRLAKAIENLSERKGQIDRDISIVNDEIELRTEEVNRREKEAHKEIVNATLELLRKDLDREDALHKASSIDFSFEKDSVTVDGRSNISASSLVILKNCFHLALLVASAKRESFRYPRLAIFDNIENMGMEPDRSQNFQRTIVETSSALDVDHQIIFTTSMIAPDLEKSDLTVGDYYTEAKKSLQMR